MALTNNNFSLKIVGVLVFILVFPLYSNGQNQNENYRFLDSANILIDIDSKKTLKFLDSISLPITKSIKGRVSEYYAIKALIYDDFSQYSKFHQANILALKYAIKEENYCVAGQASLDIYTDKYLISDDTIETKYLDQAKTFLEKCEDDKYAILQIEQMQAYFKLLDQKYRESNSILLEKLEYYDSIKNEDAYYYMFANYMLASNYIQLNELNKGHKYFKELERLSENNTIVHYNRKSFIASIDLYLAEFHNKSKQNDSVLHYLKHASKFTKYMSGDALKDYYQLSASSYKEHDDIETSKTYIDSLVWFQNDLFIENLEVSVDINSNLLEAESALNDQKKEKATTQKVVFGLFGFSALLSLVYFFFYKRHRAKIKSVEGKAQNLSYLKSNNEQLAVKVHGLEAYIKNLKKEVKDIASVKCLEHQRSRIKELYTSLHINSSTILDKGESHLELINDLNIDFFKKIEQLYPQLSKSEIIICYYILVGFTNKEIGVFLNTSVRSVESKRYRISKKIDFNKSEITLSEHLQITFGDTLHHTILSN